TGSTKAVKVRFREGKASTEVLDFNVFLSPHDVWTAGLSPPIASGGGVVINTGDNSCTLPKIKGQVTTDGQAGVEFRNLAYVGDAVHDDSLARLQEGYFEVFEMATYADDSVTAVNSK